MPLGSVLAVLSEDTGALRRTALAVAVLHDVDLLPGDDGVVLPGADLLVPWAECRAALGQSEPESDLARLRLRQHLQARSRAAGLSAAALAPLLVPAGLPVGHALHPGPGWVREHVLGGALDLGLAAVGLPDPSPARRHPAARSARATDETPSAVLLPPAVLADAGLDGEGVWPAVRARLEALGSGAAERLRADARGLLRPHGPCDAVTLLGARALRRELAGPDGLGAAVVPMRRRGWTRLALVDPAFGPAAAAATAPEDRGFDRPVLVTADEVVLAREGGDARRHALQERTPEPVPHRRR